MATFTTYTCTICKKSKSLLDDYQRAVPNNCSVTIGCEGKLLVTETKNFVDVMTPSAKIANNPNDRLVDPKPLEKVSSVSLSTSSYGSLTIAVRYNLETQQKLDIVNLKISERKSQDVPYLQYIFKTTAMTSVIPQTNTTKDINGKFLRFDSAAIQENRVIVLVNGVARVVGTDTDEIQLTPNTVTFNQPISAGSTVTVLVYFQQNTSEKILTFNRNEDKKNTQNRYGSWANIKKVNFADVLDNSNIIWEVYTCTYLGDITPNSQLQIISLMNPNGQVIRSKESLAEVRFLLSAEPFRHIDRIYNFIVNAENLSTSYNLNSTLNNFIQLSVNSNLVNEIYPPLEIKKRSNIDTDYIVEDDLTNLQGTSEEVQFVLKSKKIIGPI